MQENMQLILEGQLTEIFSVPRVPQSMVKNRLYAWISLTKMICQHVVSI